MNDTDLTTLRQRLEEAEAALHRLMVGELEVTVSMTGYGSTSYTQTNRQQLEQYISRLRSTIAKKTGRPKRGPLFITF